MKVEENKGSDNSADQHISGSSGSRDSSGSSSGSQPLGTWDAPAFADLSQLRQDITSPEGLITGSTPVGQQTADSAAADEAQEFLAATHSRSHQQTNATSDTRKESDAGNTASPSNSDYPVETANTSSSSDGIVVPVYAPLGSMSPTAAAAW